MREITRIYGTTFFVSDGKIIFGIDKNGWHIDVYVDGKIVNGISISQYRRLYKQGRTFTN